MSMCIPRNWVDMLPQEVCYRLADCITRKSDIPILVNAKWADMKRKGMRDKGFTKEDAVIYILELLDSNSCDFELTTDEYNELIKE